MGAISCCPSTNGRPSLPHVSKYWGHEQNRYGGRRPASAPTVRPSSRRGRYLLDLYWNHKKIEKRAPDGTAPTEREQQRRVEGGALRSAPANMAIYIKAGSDTFSPFELNQHAGFVP